MNVSQVQTRERELGGSPSLPQQCLLPEQGTAWAGSCTPEELQPATTDFLSHFPPGSPAPHQVLYSRAVSLQHCVKTCLAGTPACGCASGS